MNSTPHMSVFGPMVIDTIVTQHVEEMSFLWLQRSAAVHTPHFGLRQLVRHDERLAAHIDGLRVAGESGWRACEAQFSLAKPGEMFGAAVLALEAKHLARIEKLFSLGEALPGMQIGLISAFGWISAQFLQSTAKELLVATSPFRQQVGVACCAMHRVDPRRPLDTAITTEDPPLRARALRAAGELGRCDLLSVCYQHSSDKDPACRFWALWSGVLLGERRRTLDSLRTFAFFPGPFRNRALQLVLKVVGPQDGHAFLQTLAPDPKNICVLIRGSGIVGDPLYVPWLVKQMGNPKLARLAGESFSFITGLDLADLALDSKAPENLESVPNDDPNDDNVDMDPDDNLPWPDPTKIQKWWEVNKHNFPNGVRFFMGKPVSIENCKRVLREGYQRQRIAAALYLSLLQPGTPLFPTSAPAWRQQRWLAKMS